MSSILDGGSRMEPEQGMDLAVSRFTSALELVGNATSGEARSIRNMALVGRARANLHLGNLSDVVADARMVDVDFERLVDRSGINAYRYNQVLSPQQRGQRVLGLQLAEYVSRGGG